MTTMEVVQTYYQYFNQKDWAGMLSLLDDNIRHDSNQGDSRFGKEIFAGFLKHMDRCYDETLTDMVVLTNPHHPTHAACEFVVNGIYKVTDSDLPPATGQPYKLPAGAFLEVHNGKITRVTTYYNLPLWIKLISA